MDKKITDSIIYIGVDDKDIDLFESQYVVPNGVSYNSYVIMDDKIAIMDTADARVTDKWFANLREALGDRKPDYLVVSHLEPDHASNIQKVAEAYPDMQIVGNAKTFNMMGQFFDIDLTDRKVVVAEGDKLSLGKHELTFVMAPMVHWPEVMMEYESTDKVLFSADGFGKFGALDTDEDWTCEARRYYFNIVGKYGAQVQAVLKKAARLTDSKIELEEDDINRLNEQFILMRTALDKRTKGLSDEDCSVTVKYFVKDELKEGGHYEEYSGIVRTIDDYDRILIMQDGKTIRVEDILSVKII